MDILEQIQLINYKKEDHSGLRLRKEFLAIIDGHVEFEDEYLPEQKSEVGKMLVKNGIIFILNLGIFHEMWSKVMFKVLTFGQRERILPIYYHKYINILEKGITNF